MRRTPSDSATTCSTNRWCRTNNVGGTGAVGHTTEWNSAANAMVQANPNKYEIVNTPNYWQGVDY